MCSYIYKAYELKTCLENDSRIKRLNEIESKMSNDEEVIKLAYFKDLKETELSDILKYFSKDSPEVKKAQVKLFKASSELDGHPLVQEYEKLYKEVEEIYKSINKILFSEIMGDVHANCSR